MSEPTENIVLYPIQDKDAEFSMSSFSMNIAVSNMPGRNLDRKTVNAILKGKLVLPLSKEDERKSVIVLGIDHPREIDVVAVLICDQHGKWKLTWRNYARTGWDYTYLAARLVEQEE